MNRLPFSDLEPKRFEDLCLALVLPLARWQDVRHHGRSGSDEGVDILAIEALEDGRFRKWHIQCKREQSFGPAKLKRVVDEAVSNGAPRPDVLLVIVTADISLKAHEAFAAHANKKGVGQVIVWSRSVIEARLFTERRDLLYLYFGVSTFDESTARLASISRNIALKKRMRDDLLIPAEQRKPGEPPNAKFAFDDLIIRSVDDSKYPDGDYGPKIISSWFKVEPYDFYFNGIELILGIREGFRDSAGRWGVPKPENQTLEPSGFTRLNMFVLGRVPYRFIVDYDLIGDEYYPQPHVFCLFANGGKPYEGTMYAATEKPHVNILDPYMQIDLETGTLLRGAG